MVSSFDTDARQEFVEYYRRQSDSQKTWDHFCRIFKSVDSLYRPESRNSYIQVGDIGGGSGTLSRVVASHGHKAVCIDLNEALIEIGKARVKEEGLDIDFYVASATELPLEDESLDICFVAELLEHVENWEACLDEVSRVLRPKGAVFLSTTNILCPAQKEFNLPCYSWYPSKIKEYYLERVRTDRPDLANFATYPAVNWFSFYSLRSSLRKRGFVKFYDRYDLSLAREKHGGKAVAYRLIASNPITRFLAYLTNTGATIVAIKE